MFAFVTRNFYLWRCANSDMFSQAMKTYKGRSEGERNTTKGGERLLQGTRWHVREASQINRSSGSGEKPRRVYVGICRGSKYVEWGDYERHGWNNPSTEIQLFNFPVSNLRPWSSIGPSTVLSLSLSLSLSLHLLLKVSCFFFLPQRDSKLSINCQPIIDMIMLNLTSRRSGKHEMIRDWCIWIIMYNV